MAATITRRHWLRLSFGSAMGAALGGSILGCGSGARPAANGAPARAAGPVPQQAPEPPARAVILLYMAGGPSQLDTFDPKPGTPGAAGIGATGTAVPGMKLSELLPRVADHASRLAVVRSIASKEGNHARARHLMHTGHVPAGGVEHPAFGSIVSAERGRGALPSYVSIAGPGAEAGFLGAAHAPFAVGNPARPVRNLAPARFLDADRFDDRVELWRALEDDFGRTHDSETARDQRAISERAISMMRAAETTAFDLDEEPPEIRQTYGESRFGLGCLMARRLVEVGVPFIEVTQPGWDTHQDHDRRIRPLTAELDHGMSALLADLAARDLLASTLILWTGDFGRTPWISGRGGRDHYPAVTPAVLAGGGVRGGQVIGATDDTGETVIARPLTVADLFATVCAATGIDPDHTRRSRAGRPIKTVDGGTPIAGLLA